MPDLTPEAGHLGSNRVSTERRPTHQGAKAVAIVGKLLVTAVSFWYLARNIDFAEFIKAARTLDARWIALAVMLFMLEVPVVAIRWCRIVEIVGEDHHHVRRGPLIAITAISNFFAQFTPNLAADTIRAWMLARHHYSWRRALLAVMIDRGVGVTTLVAVGFTVMLFPSAQTALGARRMMALEFFGGLLALILVALIFAPRLAPLLDRSRYTEWAGRVAEVTHQVLLRDPGGFGIFAIGFGVHMMSIVAVWLLVQAAGLSLPLIDAAVLFTIMVAISLIPVSIGGWGIRELAVTALLGEHGVPLEQALFFSISFGATLMLAALPGVLVWFLYSPPRLQTATPKG